MPTSLLLFLIGYRGSGKSTVAPLIAGLINGDWVDVDDLVELSAEKPISQIFAEDGEAEFRQLEHDAIKSVAGPTNDQSPLVVSLGGGAITFQNNREIIAAGGKTVYLRGSVDTLWQRINADPVSGDQRPNLTDKGGRAEVQQMLDARSEIYESNSDFQIDIDSLAPAEIAAAIAAWWRSY